MMRLDEVLRETASVGANPELANPELYEIHRQAVHEMQHVLERLTVFMDTGDVPVVEEVPA
jgi:hypothetical protein